MQIISRIITFAALACIIASHSFATTLQPGVYKLEPKVVAASSRSKGLNVLAGRVKTDTGEIEVAVRDCNFNGTYNDKMLFSLNSTPSYDLARIDQNLQDYIHTERSADGIYIGPTHYLYRLAKAALFDGKLYTFDVSPSSDTLTVALYTGDTGTVKYEAVDGFGKPVRLDTASVYGANGLYNSAIGGNSVTIPTGDYICSSAMLKPSTEQNPNRGFQLGYYVMTPITVRKNKVSIVKLGGPLSIELMQLNFKRLNNVNPKDEEVKVKRGSHVTIDMFLILNGKRVHRAHLAACSLEVLDPTGKSLSVIKPGWGHGGIGTDPFYRSFNVSVPADWEPGTYKLRAVADTEDYQGIITAEMPLTIE